MKRSDTRIHQIELLLTLDYLLRFTDEDHPASREEICRHANDFGLKYDSKAKSGNDVRRQRITEVLDFLDELSVKYPDNVPFLLNSTKSGKYYIEQRNYLNEEQVAKVIAAIKNDKYTKDDDVELLIERVLGAFSSSEYNREVIMHECDRLLRGVKKLDKETLRKTRLIDKAFRENRLIKIRTTTVGTEKNINVNYDFWYKVYMIKEFNHSLHAFLLPVYTGKLRFFKNYIFDPIERINVVDGKDSEVLNYDEDENKDFGDWDKLFARTNPKLAQKYGTLDRMIEKTIMPNGGKTCIVTFYFPLALKKVLAKSFEEFFGEPLRYQETNIINGIEKTIKEDLSHMDNWTIVTCGDKKDQELTHGLVNISVDNDSFMSWLLSDPYANASVCIMDMIKLVKPTSLLHDVAVYHSLKMMKYVDSLNENEKDNVINFMINSFKTEHE